MTCPQLCYVLLARNLVSWEVLGLLTVYKLGRTAMTAGSFTLSIHSCTELQVASTGISGKHHITYFCAFSCLIIYSFRDSDTGKTVISNLKRDILVVFCCPTGTCVLVSERRAGGRLPNDLSQNAILGLYSLQSHCFSPADLLNSLEFHPMRVTV